MAFNLDFLKDVGGSGLNIFGAGKPKYLDRMSKLGLLDETAITEAEDKSLYKGLLGTALSYLAQPKNQNYGSAFPYLGKALMTGMEQAEDPYKTLSKEAMMNQQLGEYEKKLNAETALKDIYKTIPAQTIAQQRMGSTAPSMQTLPNGTEALAPNFGSVENYNINTPSTTVLDEEKLANLKFTNNDAYMKILQTQQAEQNILKTKAEAAKLGMDPIDYGSLEKNWQAMVRSGNTGNFKSFNDYLVWDASQKGTKIIMPENKLQSKQAETYGTDSAEISKTSWTGANNALGSIGDYDSMIKMSDEGKIYAGFGSSVQTVAARLNEKLNLGYDTEKLKNTALATRIVADQQLKEAAANKGQGTLSDSERAIMAKARLGNINENSATEMAVLAKALKKLALWKVYNHFDTIDQFSEDNVSMKGYKKVGKYTVDNRQEILDELGVTIDKYGNPVLKENAGSSGAFIGFE